MTDNAIARVWGFEDEDPQVKAKLVATIRRNRRLMFLTDLQGTLMTDDTDIEEKK